MSENLSREEKLRIFKDSQQVLKDKIKKDEEKKNNNFTREYEQIEYTDIPENEWRIIRLVSAMYTPVDKNRTPTSPKEVWQSYIINDKGKGCFINWSNDKNWFLWRVFDKIMAYKWNPDIGDNGAKEFLHKKDFPKLFNQVRRNGKQDFHKYENGWYPTKYVCLNVIDRHDMEWHKENKHTKLLSKKITIKDDKKYPAIGIPPTVYTKKIFNNILEQQKGEDCFLEDFDIAVKKSNVSGDVDYEAQHSNYLKKDESVNQFIISGLLTEEEESWVCYDLDKLFPISTYHKIMSNLGIFLREVDAKMKTAFYPELEELVAKEKVEWEKNYPKEENEVEEDSPNMTKEEYEEKETEKENIPEEKKEEVKIERKTRTKSISVSVEDKYPLVKQLSEEERQYIVGLTEDGKVQFKDGFELEGCPKCHNSQPSPMSTFCIFCGDKF